MSGPADARAALATAAEPHVVVDEPGPPEPLGSCRHCGYLSWLADDLGPVHPCCARAAPDPCEGCATSRRAAKVADRRIADWKAARMRNGFGA